MTTRNYEIAQHVGESNVILPDNPPITNSQVLVAFKPLQANGPVQTEWVDMARASGGVPSANEENQVLVSGPGPGFDWVPNNWDHGNY